MAEQKREQTPASGVSKGVFLHLSIYLSIYLSRPPVYRVVDSQPYIIRLTVTLGPFLSFSVGASWQSPHGGGWRLGVPQQETRRGETRPDPSCTHRPGLSRNGMSGHGRDSLALRDPTERGVAAPHGDLWRKLSLLFSGRLLAPRSMELAREMQGARGRQTGCSTQVRLFFRPFQRFSSVRRGRP